MRIIFLTNIALHLFSDVFRSFTNLTMTNVFFFERKARSSLYQYAVLCGEQGFGTYITYEYICVVLQHFVRLATSIRWWCVLIKWYIFSYEAFHPVSRDLVTKISINLKKVCVDKYSIQTLRFATVVSLVQESKLRYTWYCGAFA
jgi:hypothetical protein